MSTDDIKAPSIIKLKETLGAMTAEEKGTADIPDIDGLVAAAQRGSFAEGVWQSDFTVVHNDPNLYWNNNLFAAPYFYGTDRSALSNGGFRYGADDNPMMFCEGGQGRFHFRGLTAYKYLNINAGAGKVGSTAWKSVGNYDSAPITGDGASMSQAQRLDIKQDADLASANYIYNGYQWASTTPGSAALFQRRVVSVGVNGPVGAQLRKCALLAPDDLSLLDNMNPAHYSQAGADYRRHYKQTYILPENQTAGIASYIASVSSLSCSPPNGSEPAKNMDHISETELVPYAAATSKMYMQFAANLINGLRMRHALIGPWAPDMPINPGEYWEEVFGGFECDSNNVKEYKEDWLEQIENSPADIRAAWNARIIQSEGLNTLNAAEAQMNTAFRQWTFSRGLDTKGMNLMKMSDELEKNPSGWQTFVGALPFTAEAGGKSPSYFNGNNFATGDGENPLGRAIIDGLAMGVIPGKMSHPSYIPEIPINATSDTDTHPLKGVENDRFINVPGVPSPRGALDAVITISLLKDGKTMYQLVDELYTKWYIYRYIAAQSSFNGSSCGDGTGDVTGQAGVDIPGITAADHAAAAAARAEAVDDAANLLALTQTSPLEATFREQCYLLSDIFNLAGKRPTDSKPLPYIPPADGNATNASIEVNGTPFGFMNMLTGDPKMYPLMQAHHSQLSALQPTIRLFKVTDKTAVNGDRSQQEQEFNFDSHEKNYKETTTATMLQNSRTRGHGAGIKNFEFTYDGSNPFAAKKSIKATLTIFANSFDELMKLRGSDAANQYRYLDLALKTGRRNIPSEQGDCTEPTHQQGSNTTGNTAQQDAELAKLQFRLKAVVGYAKPPRNESDPTGAQFWSVRERGDRIGILQRGDKVYNDVHDAVSHSFVTINLTPTVHDFAFDDMGRVTMTIKYLAYVEDFFDSPTFNIFSDLGIAKEVLHRKMRFTKLATFCEQEKMSEIKESESQNIAQNKIDALQALFARMYTRGKIRTINLTYNQLASWRRHGPYSAIAFTPQDVETAAATLTDSIGINAAAIFAEAMADTDAERARTGAAARQTILSNGRSQNIQFFYAGDLVDEILAGIEEYLAPDGMRAKLDDSDYFKAYPADPAAPITQCEIDFEKYKIEKFAEQFKRFRTVLGPIELVNQANLKDSRFTNFGNVPVSVKYFTEWLTKQMLTKERAEYPLPHFLNNFFNMLIRNFLNDDTCFSTNIKQKIRVNQAVVTDYTSQEAWNRKAESEYESIDTLTYETLRYTDALGSYAPLRVASGRLTYGPDGRVVTRRLAAGVELPLPALNISGPDGDRHSTTTGLDGGLDRETNYLIYYAGRTKPTEQMTGDPTIDINNGILHYGMGLQNGIVRDISLKKTEAPYLPEVRFEQEGYDGLQQLRVTYDADIKTFPLPNAFPGQYLYIDPTTFAPGAALWEDRNAAGEVYNLTHFGIGGYFMIIRSTHRFGPGEATTTIQAKWVAEHEGRNQEVNAAGDAVDAEDGGSTLDRGRCNEAQNLRALGSLGDYIDSPEQEEAAREALENPEVGEAP
ncbi:hypothetical protein N9915_00580 [Akkermansiaceae bacterium]|nr:hypothetical protein [Akkermansiaceae bacterium]